jgi:RNA polymerase sigma-70 factor (ECF subfamily)
VAQRLADCRPQLVRAVAGFCRDRDDAEDVVQEALLRGLRYAHATRSGHNPLPWLVGIARNVLADLVRRQRAHRERADDGTPFDPIAPAAGEPELDLWIGRRIARQGDVQRALARAFEELPPLDRHLLQRRHEDGVSIRPLALECGLRPEAVKVRLFRARRKVARRLRQLLSLEEPSRFEGQR